MIKDNNISIFIYESLTLDRNPIFERNSLRASNWKRQNAEYSVLNVDNYYLVILSNKLQETVGIV